MEKLNEILNKYSISKKSSIYGNEELKEELNDLIHNERDDAETKLLDWLANEDLLTDESGKIADEYDKIRKMI